LVALARLSEGRTTFWISHHLAAVSHVGHIIYMSEGRILEEGTHDELMALDGGHAATYRVQAVDSNSTAQTVATAEGTAITLQSSRAASRGRSGGVDNQVELLGAVTFPETQ
jgi:ABC-type multidrug transport system ATPase subunit